MFPKLDSVKFVLASNHVCSTLTDSYLCYYGNRNLPEAIKENAGFG